MPHFIVDIMPGILMVAPLFLARLWRLLSYAAGVMRLFVNPDVPDGFSLGHVTPPQW
jgi:hypothetical protein